MSKLNIVLVAFTIALFGTSEVCSQRSTSNLLDGRVAATLDLATREGAALAKAAWQTCEAKIFEVSHREPGEDLRASGAPNLTLDIQPKADDEGFDKAAWESLSPEGLETRRGHGRFSFRWYRTKVAIPTKVAEARVEGLAVVFDIVVDDYAEVWVNKKLALSLGAEGGSAIAGFNARNRVVLSERARPGEIFELAVFCANGPLSKPPPNFIWVRNVTLDFVTPPTSESQETEIIRKDAELDMFLAPGTKIERLATGFGFTEGPSWSLAQGLVFSDPNENTIWRYDAFGRLEVLCPKSGYSGTDVGEYRQPGSNGTTNDREGRLVFCQHGNRRVVRVETTGAVTVLADRFEGHRLNSPNDLVYRSDGTLYFTDPIFGLKRGAEDPARELPFTGVFCLREGKLSVVSKELSGPNGIALSPDETTLYVANWDTERKVILAYPVNGDGSLGASRVFADLTSFSGEEALDGLKVNAAGHVLVSGPIGVSFYAADGRHLGILRGPELPANFCFGGADGRTLFLTARTDLYRIRTLIPGATTLRSGG